MKKQRLKLINELRKRINSGEYKPGTILNEKEICKEFGISRTPYRDALVKLESEHLIQINPNKGAEVASINLNTIKDIFEMRAILERAAAQLSFKRIQSHHLKALKDVVERIEYLDPDNSHSHLDLDTEFHEIILAAQGNQILKENLFKLRNQCLQLWNSIEDQNKIKKLRIESVRDIKNVYKAFVAKDQDAVEKAMHEHFVANIRNLVSHILDDL